MHSRETHIFTSLCMLYLAKHILSFVAGDPVRDRVEGRCQWLLAAVGISELPRGSGWQARPDRVPQEVGKPVLQL